MCSLQTLMNYAEIRGSTRRFLIGIISIILGVVTCYLLQHSAQASTAHVW